MFDWKELLDLPEYIKLFAGLLAIVNPFLVVPVFAGLTQNRTPAEKNRISFIAAVTVIIALSLFTFLGEVLLRLFGITIEAFQIAGGILLLLTAISMLAEKQKSQDTEIQNGQERSSIGVAPIGIPLLAGPGGISTIIVYTHRHPSLSHDLVIFFVILFIGFMVYWVLRFGNKMLSKLGDTGISVFNRVMGLLVAAIGVEFIVAGAGALFPGLIR